MNSRIATVGLIGLCSLFASTSTVTAQQPPSKVLVVNTQDASVSLVGLASMKEEKRFPVGARPYGIAVSKDGKTVAVGVEDEECVKFFSFISNIGDATLQLAELSADGKLKSLGKAQVGKAPKRVAFIESK